VIRKSVRNLSAMLRALDPSFQRNLMITLWSYSISNIGCPTGY
jgi:hypothetical protein